MIPRLRVADTVDWIIACAPYSGLALHVARLAISLIVEECPCFCGAHANPAFARNFRRVARCFAFAFAVGDQTAHAAIAWTWTKKRIAWVADSNVYIHAVAKLCCNDCAVFFASLAFRNANISLGKLVILAFVAVRRRRSCAPAGAFFVALAAVICRRLEIVMRLACAGSVACLYAIFAKVCMGAFNAHVCTTTPASCPPRQQRSGTADCTGGK